MKTLGSLISILVFLGLLAVFGWGVYLGVKYIISQFAFIDQTTSAILIIVSTVALVGCLIIAGAIKSDFRSRKIAFEVQRAEMYNQFVEVWLKPNKSDAEKQQIPVQMETLNKMIALWGSPQIIKQYKQLIQMTGSAQSDKTLILQQTEKILLELRKHAGESNQNIRKKDLTDIILHNFEIS